MVVAGGGAKAPTLKSPDTAASASEAAKSPGLKARGEPHPASSAAPRLLRRAPPPPPRRVPPPPPRPASSPSACPALAARSSPLAFCAPASPLGPRAGFCGRHDGGRVLRLRLRCLRACARPLHLHHRHRAVAHHLPHHRVRRLRRETRTWGSPPPPGVPAIPGVPTKRLVLVGLWSGEGLGGGRAETPLLGLLALLRGSARKEQEPRDPRGRALGKEITPWVSENPDAWLPTFCPGSVGGR